MNTLTIQLIKYRALFFVFAFTALSVLTPMFFHYFGGVGAGRMFLPMQIFVLVAGLTLGWRAGLAVGVLTPLISYSFTGMPVIGLLPFIAIETAAYGLFAGLFRENLKNIRVSLVAAMLVGRLFLFLGMAILPTKLVASAYVLSAIKAGWIGILLQLAVIPVIVMVIQKFLKNERI